MSVLSGKTIKHLIKHDKLLVYESPEYNYDHLINGASVDIRLGSQIKYAGRYDPSGGHPVKSWCDSNESKLRSVDIEYGDTFVIDPGDFVIAHSIEQFNIGENICAYFQLKSRLARIGLAHQLAGFIDPGFNSSNLVLELYNVAPYPIEVCVGQRIGQVSFHELDANTAGTPFSYKVIGSYNGRSGAVAAQQVAVSTNDPSKKA